MAGTVRTCETCGQSFASVRPRRCCSAECFFWSCMDRSGGPDACWPWKGHISPSSGYGDVPARHAGGRRTTAHRHAWKLAKCCDPGALCVLHRCDNRKCANPAHLFLGTHRTNTWDAWRKGRATVCAPGEGHHKAKLTEAIVRELRESFTDDQLDTGELAERYGVSRTTILAAYKRQTWRHIE